METVWFTSDTHFGHARIIELANRPWSSVEEMDEGLIETWNKFVAPSDRVYHLGDFSFHRPAKTLEVLSRLNGQIHLIYGNHDGKRMGAGLNDKFASYSAYKVITVDGQKVVLFHFPIEEWDRAHKGSWHLHGHQHGNGPKTSLPRMDVGVDCTGYRPLAFEEVAEIMQDREWVPVSHH